MESLNIRFICIVEDVESLYTGRESLFCLESIVISCSYIF